jgi:hypothetical protein
MRCHAVGAAPARITTRFRRAAAGRPSPRQGSRGNLAGGRGRGCTMSREEAVVQLVVGAEGVIRYQLWRKNYFE